MSAKKEDFVRMFSKISGFPLSKSRKIYEYYKETLITVLTEYKEFRLLDFGTYKIETRKAKKGMNPKTGEQVDIPPRQYLKFIPCRRFKHYIKDLGSDVK